MFSKLKIYFAKTFLQKLQLLSQQFFASHNFNHIMNRVKMMMIHHHMTLQYVCLLQRIRIVKDNQFSLKTDRATEVFDFFLDFLEELNSNSTIPLSRGSGAGSEIEGVSFLITRLNFLLLGRLALTDLSVDDPASLSKVSSNTLSESTDLSLTESSLNSESD